MCCFRPTCGTGFVPSPPGPGERSSRGSPVPGGPERRRFSGTAIDVRRDRCRDGPRSEPRGGEQLESSSSGEGRSVRFRDRQANRDTRRLQLERLVLSAVAGSWTALQKALLVHADRETDALLLTVADVGHAGVDPVCVVLGAAVDAGVVRIAAVHGGGLLLDGGPLDRGAFWHGLARPGRAVRSPGRGRGRGSVHGPGQRRRTLHGLSGPGAAGPGRRSPPAVFRSEPKASLEGSARA